MHDHTLVNFVLSIVATVVADLFSTWLRGWLNSENHK